MDDVIAMSYGEIAEKLGIELDSARRLVRRRRWHRRTANDGKVLIDVPVDYSWERPGDRDPQVPTDRPGSHPPPDHAEVRVALAELEIKGLQALVESERRRAETEALRADAEARRADETGGRLERAEAERNEWRDRWIRDVTTPWWRRRAG